MPASLSTVITGAIGFISICFGTLFSAFLINRLRISQNAKKCTLLAFGFYLVSSFCFLILLNYCPEDKFTNSSDLLNCMNCDCSNKFNPVNGSNSAGLIYKSPCHAGCTRQIGDNTFANCKCVNSDVSQALNLSSSYCDKDIKCMDKLVLNGLAAFLIVLFTSMAIVPHLKAELGCVTTKSEQAFVLGMQAALVALFGNFEGTVLVGKVLDLTCVHWQSNEYGQQVCKLYNNELMSLALVLIGFCCRFSTTTFLLALFLIFFFRERRDGQRGATTVAANPNQIELEQSR
jgi:hypothetical protein